MFIPIIEPIIPDIRRIKYEIINFIENGLLVMIEIIIDISKYIIENFKPSR